MMKKMNRTICCWILSALFILFGINASGQSPELLNFQGVLMDSSGRAVSDGSYQMSFSVWDEPGGAKPGNKLFEQIIDVHVEAGIYAVILSDQPSYSLMDAFAGAPRFMQIEIISGGGYSNAVMSRERIASVPYAITTKKAVSLSSPPEAQVQNSIVPPGLIILWDQSNTCPDGWGVAEGFETAMIRGAMTNEPPGGEIPSVAGVTCPGNECSGNDDRYNDHIELNEMEPHEHLITVDSQVVAGVLTVDSGNKRQFVKVTYGDPVLNNDGGDVVILNAGGNAPHFHPFVTVLFCKKLP